MSFGISKINPRKVPMIAPLPIIYQLNPGLKIATANPNMTPTVIVPQTAFLPFQNRKSKTVEIILKNFQVKINSIDLKINGYIYDYSNNKKGQPSCSPIKGHPKGIPIMELDRPISTHNRIDKAISFGIILLLMNTYNLTSNQFKYKYFSCFYMYFKVL